MRVYFLLTSQSEEYQQWLCTNHISHIQIYWTFGLYSIHALGQIMDDMTHPHNARDELEALVCKHVVSMNEAM
jgi:hypothetical protein